MRPEELIETISSYVDERREEISKIVRVVNESANTPLEQTAVVMALPLFYAHWEGFVKEALQLYIEFIDKKSLLPENAHPIIFSYSFRKRVTALSLSGSVERFSEFANWIIKSVSKPISFEDVTVDTRSNLSFNNLKEICDKLRIDVARLIAEKRKIDKLVHRRNNIAHTGRPLKLEEGVVGEDAALTISLIEKFEEIMRDCIAAESYTNKLENADKGVSQSMSA